MTTLESGSSSSSKPEIQTIHSPSSSGQDGSKTHPLPPYGAKLALLIEQRQTAEREAIESSPDPFFGTSSPPIKILKRLSRYQEKLTQKFSDLTLIENDLELPEDYPSSAINDQKERIPRLKEGGYLGLVKKLEKREGYPWSEFQNIHHPLFLEQLVNITLICEQKALSEDDKKKVIDFSLNLLDFTSFLSKESDVSLPSEEMIKNSHRIMGKLMYLIDNDLELTLEIISKNNLPAALTDIKNGYSKHLLMVCDRLNQRHQAHLRTQLQDPEITLHTNISIEIGKALMTKAGVINTGIIDSLTEIFISPDQPKINHEINLSYALFLIRHSSEFRDEIEAIESPALSTNPSQEVIRASLSIPPEVEIGAYETKLTALIATLSHLRQGSDRSCFAISVAIELLSSHLVFSLKDLRQLLEDGKLTRKGKLVNKDIPFIKRINDENLLKEVALNSEGKIILNGEVKAPLWEAPGIIAACQAIGIHDPQTVFLALLPTLPSVDEGEMHTIKISEIIRRLCLEVSSQQENSETLDSLTRRAFFAFSSQTTQPLLKIWENSIANMAEAEEGNMIKPAIMKCIIDALQLKLGQLSIPPSLLLQKFFLKIQELLYERIHLQYDPTIGNSSSEEVFDTAGGFTLYNKNMLISDEASFRYFVNDILVEAGSALSQLSLSRGDRQQLDRVLSILEIHLETPAFIHYLIARYHPDNCSIVSSAQKLHQPLNYAHMNFLPWQTRKGSNSKSLFRFYLESSSPIESENFAAKDAQEALKNIIEICRGMPENEKRLFINNPNKLKPFCILQKHRLPFMAGAPALVEAWKQETPAETWIESYIKENSKIANSPIDSTTQEKLLDALSQILPRQLSPIISHIRETREGAPHSPPTIREFRNHILESCMEYRPSSVQVVRKWAQKIDTAIYESLPQPLQNSLEQSAIHFADTNWSRGAQDLHFCFVLNPGSGQIELWEVQSDGSALKALDQYYWLVDQQWEFMTVPRDLIPDDSTYLDKD